MQCLRVLGREESAVNNEAAAAASVRGRTPGPVGRRGPKQTHSDLAEPLAHKALPTEGRNFQELIWTPWVKARPTASKIPEEISQSHRNQIRQKLR